MVPTSVIFWLGGSDAGSSGDHAIPKSARRAGPEGVLSRMLAVLTSRWMIPFECI